MKESEEHVVPEEYVPPELVTEFQTARLFLSHFGYLNVGGDRKVPSFTLIHGSLIRLTTNYHKRGLKVLTHVFITPISCKIMPHL